MAQSDSYSDLPASASHFRASHAPEHPQRRHPPLHPKHTPTPLAPTAPAPAPQRPTHRPQNAASRWQAALFRATAPPILFSILIAGLLVELRARLAQPLPAAPPGLAVSVSMRTESDSAVQRVLMWAEGQWPGAWALPVLCAVTLGALRAVIWAGAAVLDGFVERADAGRAARVRVGRWEDGGSVSGSELLAGMFT